MNFEILTLQNARSTSSGVFRDFLRTLEFGIWFFGFFGPNSFLVLQRLFSLLWIWILSYHFTKIPTSRPYVLSTWILRAVQIQLVFYSGSLRSLLTQIFPTCWSAADTLIFSGRGYFVYSCLLPLWTQYLSRTVLGVAAPLAEPTKTSRPWKQHVRLPFGVVVLKEVSAW